MVRLYKHSFVDLTEPGLSTETKAVSIKVLYLHGFASGPGSKKAAYFRQRFLDRNMTFMAPDLNVPNFFAMTLSSQLTVCREALLQLKTDQEDKLFVFGSSLGGLLASILQAEIPHATYVLLAPGFGITQRWTTWLGQEEMEKWQRENSRLFPHHATGKDEALSFEFVRDFAKHQLAVQDPLAEAIHLPARTYIFHGELDQTVPSVMSEKVAEANERTTQLFKLKDGHELIESLPFIWQTVEPLLDSKEK